ncbi:hypothetical protein B0682_04995 [Moraxella lincolnii]|uniref:Uncharacterized protein n=2 Tax=Lwoffella lincolnii TaxID=90241 RepID=A0A1T0CI27_9GAMM|nr:hypothetical protein B0682_04995 [Moraxella lincolnii]
MLKGCDISDMNNDHINMMRDALCCSLYMFYMLLGLAHLVSKFLPSFCIKLVKNSVDERS